MPRRFINNKNKKHTHIHTKNKNKKSLAEMKQLIKLFVYTPSFTYRPKLVASGTMELKCLAFVGKALRLSYKGYDNLERCG